MARRLELESGTQENLMRHLVDTERSTGKGSAIRFSRAKSEIERVTWHVEQVIRGDVLELEEKGLVRIVRKNENDIVFRLSKDGRKFAREKRY